VSAPARTPRFLDLYHAGEAAAGEINDYIDAWTLSPSTVALHVYLGMTWAEFQEWRQTGLLPTAAVHSLEHSDLAWVGDEVQGHWLRVHPPMRCRPACPIHWPSKHPLAGAPLAWDQDAGVINRTCGHGVDHPDPDDQQVRLHPDLGEHDGCDGCCTAATIPGELATPGGAVTAALRELQATLRRSIPGRPS
jgi:hypothetical protein